MKPRPFVAVMVALLLISSGVFAQKVSTDFDNEAEFSKYKTYAWAKGAPARDPLMHQRIVAAIDAQLVAKGLKQVDPDKNPDAYVLYQASVTEQQELQVWGTGYGRGWRYGGRMTQVDVNKILIGQLIVDIGDAASQKVVWRGRASDTLSDKPEKNAQKIQKATAKMFKNFPPAKK